MLNSKLEKLKSILKNMKSVLVAYSGGVDSTFLLKIAKETIGDNVLAVTAKSETYPEREYRQAKKIAKKLKIKHLIITTRELSNSHFRANPANRCYYCKRELFTKLKQVASDKGINHIADGTNCDDIGDFRPGMKACKELEIRSPLKEAGLTKKEIRMLSFKMKLPTWNKPVAACLASRFPYGTPIDKKKVRMVDEAENYLSRLGLRQIRVRHHDGIARIEVLPNDIQRFASPGLRDEILEKFKDIGYHYITLDLQGYRTGSLNEVLKERSDKNGRKKDFQCGR
jgi:uncharacterized protein